MKGKARTALGLLSLFAIVWLVSRAHHGDTPSAVERGARQVEARERGWLWSAQSSAPSQKGASIRGRVWSRSGNALSGARVCAACAACDTLLHGNEPVCTAPDAHGDYVIARMNPGTYQLSAAADGHLPRAIGGVPVQLRDKDLNGQDAELSEGGSEVSGTVTDATGGPVAGAIVQASFTSPELMRGRMLNQTTTSDEAGVFRLSGLEGSMFIAARAEGYAAMRLPGYAPSRGLRLVLAPEASIAGRVLSLADGEPVANVRVHARGEGWEQTAETGADGNYQLQGLRPGSYELEAAGAGFIGRHAGSVVVDLADALHNVDISVQPAVQVSGRVHSGNTPCVTGRVYLSPAPGEALPTLSEITDGTGQVTFPAVPPGNYQSTITCENYAQQAGPSLSVVDAALQGIDWALVQGLTLRVYAETTSKEPVEQAWVSLDTQGPGAGQGLLQQTDNRGFTEFLGVKVGSYNLNGPDLDKPLVVDVALASGVREIHVTLRPVGAIEVTVKDSAGRANDEVAVSALPVDNSHPGGTGEARGGGRYRIGPLPAGEYQVEVRDGVSPRALAGSAKSAVQVRTGQVARVEATYGGYTGRITGRVVDPKGAPVENVWVAAAPADAETDAYGQMLLSRTRAAERRCLTNAEGQFVLEELLESATYTVSARHSLGGNASRAGVKTSEQVELALAAPARVSGLVLDASGSPPDYFQIVVSNRDQKQVLSPMFGPDAQGRWSVDHVAPGSVEVRAQAASGVATNALQLLSAQRVDGITLKLAPQLAARN
jgi:hypothetical protein